MRRALLALPLAVVLALLVVPLASSGVTTYHGQFTSAEGLFYPNPPPNMTYVAVDGLFLKGPWNIAVRDGAAVGDVVQVTGEPIFLSTSRHCDPGPCGQWFPLGWSPGGALGDWTIDETGPSLLKLTKAFPWFGEGGGVFFTYNLVLNTASGELTIRMPIDDRKCPYGWRELIFYGSSHGS